MPDKEPQAPLLSNEEIAQRMRDAFANVTSSGPTDDSTIPSHENIPAGPQRNIDPVSHPFDAKVSLQDALADPKIPLTGEAPDYAPSGLLKQRIPDPVKLGSDNNVGSPTPKPELYSPGAHDQAGDNPHYKLRRKLIGGSLALFTLAGTGVAVAAVEGAFSSGHSKVAATNTSRQHLSRVSESGGVDTILPPTQTKSTTHSTPESKVPAQILAERPESAPSIEDMDKMATSSFEALPQQVRLWYVAAKMQEVNDLGPVTANINDSAESIINGPYKEALGFAYGQVDKTTGAKLLSGVYFSNSSETYQNDKSRILDANRDTHAPLSGIYDNEVIVDRGSYFDNDAGYTIPYADISYTLTTADQGEHSYTDRFYFVSLYNKQMQPYGSMWLRGNSVQ